MASISELLKPGAPIAPPADAQAAAAELSAACGGAVYPESVTLCGEAVFFVSRQDGEHEAAVACRAAGPEPAAFSEFPGNVEIAGGLHVRTSGNPREAAAALRAHLPFLRPKLIGLATSLGLGDRLGLATPGHVRAIRGTGLAPYFAQQSIREMTRTKRTPQEVQDMAALGAMQAGWRGGYGSDADHLKTVQDIDYCLAAGFTMFTIDPGDHVDGAADGLQPSSLAAAFRDLPWKALETSAGDCLSRYAGSPVSLDGAPGLEMSEAEVMRAAVKYGRAVAHVAVLYRHLSEKAGAGRFELEVSVDETDAPTSVAEHYYVASELARLGVQWVSLAPRFVGRFEKGVDYIGDLAELRTALAGHAAVARTLGPYKLSIHSGSDKFSVYPLAAEAARGLVHVKTAGTSYLEALRTLASGADCGLFREILKFAIERYEEDKKSYHVSAQLGKVPRPERLKDAELAEVLEQFDARQALHVTFGSVLNTGSFKPRLVRALADNEEMHYGILARHLGRHAAPFARK
ncbi:MAG TPA: tagaturonate epimerase family protein [Planctomycetota bacterium]|nr:tagaturonate epimerase family protein [Planctomycetota bacterium]